MNDSPNNNLQRWNAWAQLRKQAADPEAVAIKDPTDVGKPKDPEFPANSTLNFPDSTQTNPAESTEEFKNICKDSNPAPIGQGDRITARDGDALDNKANSPTAPLSKIATDLQDRISVNLNKAIEATKSASQTPEPVVTEPVNAETPVDASMQEKLASIGALWIATEEGKNATNRMLAEHYGTKQASELIQSAFSDLEKQASAPVRQYTDEQLIKLAADRASHVAWLNYFKYDFEKRAYQEAAADADMMGAQVEADQQPDLSQLSEEDIMAILQEMLASGVITQDEVDQMLGGMGADGEIGGTPEQIAAELQALVEQGVLTPENAEVVAQSLLAQQGQANPAVEKAASEQMHKAASCAGLIEQK